MDNKSENLNERIALRPVVLPDDEEFLIALYYTCREDLQMAPIAEEQKKSISLMQYLAQKQHYEKQFPPSGNDIILLDGKAIGRLWIARLEKEIVGVEFIILPEYRNHKIGTKLLKDLFAEAVATNREFNFYVLKMNEKAQRLYKRLNCEFIDETPTHFKMQWQRGREFIRNTSK
jgi:GNAT superfamily N-acetyltransferase